MVKYMEYSCITWIKNQCLNCVMVFSLNKIGFECGRIQNCSGKLWLFASLLRDWFAPLFKYFSNRKRCIDRYLPIHWTDPNTFEVFIENEVLYMYLVCWLKFTSGLHHISKLTHITIETMAMKTDCVLTNSTSYSLIRPTISVCCSQQIKICW